MPREAPGFNIKYVNCGDGCRCDVDERYSALFIDDLHRDVKESINVCNNRRELKGKSDCWKNIRFDMEDKNETKSRGASVV